MPKLRKEVWFAGEDWYPITSTASLIGKNWYPVIVYRLIENGPLGFNALQEEVGGISSKVLSDTLEDLEEKDIVNREIVNEKPDRVEYSLTELGKSFEPVIFAIRDWGLEYLQEPEEESTA